MRKVLLVIMLLLSVGCSKPQEIVEVKVEGASTASEITFCKEGYCTANISDSYAEFIESMILIESKEELEDEWATMQFDDHTFTYYSNDMVVYDDVVYTVSNIDDLKKDRSHEYKLQVFGSKLYPLKDIVENYEFEKVQLRAGYKGIPSYDIYIKKNIIESIIDQIHSDQASDKKEK